MFRRKAYDTLETWRRQSQGQTAMLIEGARRVGKTTLARGFAKERYKTSIYIDFSTAGEDVLDIFRNHRENVDEFLRLLQLHYLTRLEPRESVIIFDEVQRFPTAREYIKHLVADGRYDYIETGSLVSLRKNVQDIVIPSEEERLKLQPLDFEEYLWAMDAGMMADAIRNARMVLKPLPNSLHAKCAQTFNEYMLVGGMPQAVAAFIQDQDYTRCDRIKRQILSLYDADIEKFGGADSRRALGIFRDVPSQLSHGSKRFRFSRLGKGTDFHDCESALLWLEDAHLVNICRKCDDPAVGYRLHTDGSMLKCYMADTGLLVSHVFADETQSMRIYRDLQFGKLSVNNGMFTENVVAQQLTAQGDGLYYHTWEEPPAEGRSNNRQREVDFLVTRGFSDAAGRPRVCPVEVKSSKSYTTVSLDDFARRYGARVGDTVVVHPKGLVREGHRLRLPLYMSFCI